MSVKKVTLEELQFEHRLLIATTVGEAAALEKLTRELKTAAGTLWTERREELAEYLRDHLIPHIEKLSAERRETQQRYQEQHDEDWPEQ